MTHKSTSLSSMLEIKQIARIMGGEAHGNQASVPGPGHSPRDRSLSIKLAPKAPDGLLVHSFAGDDPIVCKDFVREKLGLPRWGETAKQCGRQKRAQAAVRSDDRDHNKRQLDKARWLWARRSPLEGSLGQTYLRSARGYGCALPATLGFLPPLKSEHHPALIAAFGLANEPEPGLLSIEDDQVYGVHLTLLKSDGSNKAGTERDKFMVGQSNGWPLMLTPPNDLLGLVLCEGIESGLSLYEATGCGVWAAGSASRMATLAERVPLYIDCVTIVGEADAAGRNGAVAFAERLDTLGLHRELKFLANDKARTA